MFLLLVCFMFASSCKQGITRLSVCPIVRATANCLLLTRREKDVEKKQN